MIDSSPVVDPASGTIYVGTADPNRALVAINPNGTQKWAIALGGFSVRAAPAIRRDGSLVVSAYRYIQVNCNWSGKGRVFHVSAQGTVLHMSEEYKSATLSAPLIDQYGDYAYVLYRPFGSDDQLIRFDPSFASSIIGGIHYGVTGSFPSLKEIFGALLELYPLGPVPFNPPPAACGPGPPPVEPLTPSPALDILSKQILVTSWKTAVIKWPGGGKVWTKDVFGLTTPAIGGLAYIGTANKRMEAWDLTGQKRWEAPLGVPYPLTPPALGDPQDAGILGSKRVYFGGSNGALYAFESMVGLKWAIPIGNKFVGPPVVIRMGFDHIIVAASDQNRLFAFRRDGALLWFVPLDSLAAGSPALARGAIYVATRSSLYKIGASPIVLPPTGHPKISN